MRELENVVERAVALCLDDQIDVQDLPRYLRKHDPGPERPEGHTLKEARKRAGDRAEKRFIQALLEEHKGNVSHVARSLEMTRRNVYLLLEKHGLNAAEWRKS